MREINVRDLTLFGPSREGAKTRSHDGFVDRLGKTWSQVTVQMECGIHYHSGKFFNIRLNDGLLTFASFAPSREPGLDLLAYASTEDLRLYAIPSRRVAGKRRLER